MISHSKIALLCVIAMAVASLFATAGSAAAAGTIEGEVLDSVSKVGISGAEVCAVKPIEFGGEIVELEFYGCTETEPNGEYALGGLANGDYIVEFWAPYLGYVTQYFDSVATPEDADEVSIAGGAITGIDAEMDKGGTISGRVIDAATGLGLEEVGVCASAAPWVGGCEETNSSGNYSIKGLATGSYAVRFFGEAFGYEARYYSEQVSPASANLVNVLAPGTTAGIDARLSKPGSVVIRPVPPAAPTTPVLTTVKKPQSKEVKCRKGFKKVKRHGRKVCVKKHKKKHRS